MYTQHRDTPDNNETTYFDFTDENFARAEKIMAKYPANYRQAAIIPLLDLAQRQASRGGGEGGGQPLETRCRTQQSGSLL